MSKAGRRRNRLKAAVEEVEEIVLTGEVETIAGLVAERNFRLVKLQRSNNKFLGTEHPRSEINPNGYDVVERAKQRALMELEAATQRHAHG